MEIFKNKFLIKLIAVISLILIAFMFGTNTHVYAEPDEDVEEKIEDWGGVLLKPIIKLVTGIGDGIMNLLEKHVNDNEPAFVRMKGPSSWWQMWGNAVAGLLIGVAVAVTVISAFVTAGGSLITSIGVVTFIKISAAAVIGAGATGWLIADVSDGETYADTIYLPNFTISVDKIFSNEVPLLDINFFQEKNPYYSIKNVTQRGDMVRKQYSTGKKASINDYLEFEHFPDCNNCFIEYWMPGRQQLEYIINAINPYVDKDSQIDIGYAQNQDGGGIDPSTEGYYVTSTTKNETIKTEGKYEISRKTRNIIIYRADNKNSYEIQYERDIEGGATFYSPTITVWKIENRVIEEPVETLAMQLRPIVSSWYYVLRNFALVVLMLVLIYSGIKIVISSTAGEKAKYKERLIDWLVAICLVMVMHYIMIFAVTIGEKITELVVSTVGADGREIIIKITDSQYEDIKSNETQLLTKIATDPKNKDGEIEKGHFLTWETDLMGAMKIKSQQEKEGTLAWAALGIAYVILAFFTVFFLWTYLRRVVYMAFLTMMAPLVAMTYPIDKMTDGKAQAFNTWLKEYIFNLLIQPMHLLLYTVLITSAYELATKNAIYTLVAIGFMMPAEKLVRRFFGFDKAQTPGMLGGAAGAALAMTGLQKITRFGTKTDNRVQESSQNEETNKINISRSGDNPYDTMLDSGNDNNKTPHMAGDKQSTTGNALVEDAKDAGSQPTVEVNVKTQTTPQNSEEDNSDTSRQAYDKLIRESEEEEFEEQRNKPKQKTRTRLGRTIKGVSGAYVRGLGNKALKRIKKGRPIRALARGAVGLTAGAVLGTTGLALGIATGDPTKSLQYAGTLGVGGYSMGKGLAGKAVDTVSVDGKAIEKELKQSWYGDEYMEKKLEEDYIKDLMSEKNIDAYRTLTGCSRGEAKEFLREKGKIYYNNGIRNIEDMQTIEKALANEDIPDIQTAIAAMKLKKNLPSDLSKMSKDKRDKYKETYQEIYKNRLKEINQGRNVDEAEIDKLAEKKADDTIRYIIDLELTGRSLYEA